MNLNKKSIKTLLWIAFGSSILFFVITTPNKSPESYLYTLLISCMYTFGYGISNGVLNDFLNKKFPWTIKTRERTIWGVALTIVLNTLLTYALNYINFVVIQGIPINDFFSSKWNFSNWFMINFALLISAVLHAKGFMEAWKKTTKQEVIEQKFIAKSANAQFESLKNQLDPHFLFNSLNVLSSLIDESPDQAQHFTASMSKVYRYILEQKDKELISVEEELDFAKTYCELLKTRFEESVHFEFDVRDEDQKSFVVPLSLQLLLENCIKHNFATSAKPLRIKIYTESAYLWVENTLQKRENLHESSGIGLNNIVQRYAMLTDRNVFIEKSDHYFKVKIPLLTEKLTVMNTLSLTDEQIAYEKASKRVKELKDFYGNLISYCVFVPFLFFINYRTSPNYWWAFWPMLGWGIGVISHGIKVFGISSNWEEKQIRKYMQKEEEESKKWK